MEIIKLSEKEIKEKVKKLDDEAHSLVLGYTAGCALAGANPLPFVSDTAIITPAQVAMLYAIGKKYDLNFENTALVGLATNVLAANIGKMLVTNLIKLVPIAGSFIGGAISVGVAGVITYGMGFAFYKYCSSLYEDKLKGKEVDTKISENLFHIINEQIKNTNWDDIKGDVEKAKPINVK